MAGAALGLRSAADGPPGPSLAYGLRRRQRGDESARARLSALRLRHGAARDRGAQHHPRRRRQHLRRRAGDAAGSRRRDEPPHPQRGATAGDGGEAGAPHFAHRTPARAHLFPVCVRRTTSHARAPPSPTWTARPRSPCTRTWSRRATAPARGNTTSPTRWASPHRLVRVLLLSRRAARLLALLALLTLRLPPARVPSPALAG